MENYSHTKKYWNRALSGGSLNLQPNGLLKETLTWFCYPFYACQATKVFNFSVSSNLLCSIFAHDKDEREMCIELWGHISEGTKLYGKMLSYPWLLFCFGSSRNQMDALLAELNNFIEVLGLSFFMRFSSMLF